MHELAIADALVQIAVRHAEGRPVARVEVEVGHLRQVVPAALAFSFALCAEGTPVEGAELAITQVPAAGDCPSCEAERALDSFPLLCPECGGEVELTRGEELRVTCLELDVEQELQEPMTTTSGRAAT
ncbi:MAG TPA: hydrogenase maturation nickel metallochaperone HypA [Conexibacter sp.]|jgi:hydrogenase nickel incorporation protein HypA/HybF